jgi:4-azaleucine resistance transporter AzlC
MTEAPAASRPFRRGFLAMAPLWAGVVPFAIAFGVLARAAGYSALETQALSLFVFAGAAQVATVTLTAAGATATAIIITAILLNLRHVLYGLSLAGYISREHEPPRPLLAFLLTDEVYGLAVREYLQGRGSRRFLLGAGLSLYLSFNLGTLAGILLGSALPNPAGIGLDFIFPLTFLVLLVPLLRSPRDLAAAAASGALAVVLSHYAAPGTTILVSSITAALLSTFLRRRVPE